MKIPSLNTQIFTSALLGIALGAGFAALGKQSPLTQQGLYVAGIVGTLFVDLLKMVLVPLVFTSIAVGVASLRAHKQMHRVWVVTLGFFVLSMAIAIASGVKTPAELEPMAAKWGRPFFQGTGVAMYNEQAPERSIKMFEECAAALRRGNGLYIQMPCQPLSFDFTMANAYPFYSHSAFDPIKAYAPEQLKTVFRDPSWRAAFRENAKNPRPGMIFQGNWDRVMVAVAQKASNARYVNRYLHEIAAQENRDPLDVMLDLSLDENLETAFLGRFLNVGDDGVARLLKHEAGVVALSDAGAHLSYMCDAGFGLHLLSHWVRETGCFTLAEGIRRLTSEPAQRFRIPRRGRLQLGMPADLLLFDPDTVGMSRPLPRHDLPAGGQRMIREPRGVHGVWVNGTQVFDGQRQLPLVSGPGHVLDQFEV